MTKCSGIIFVLAAMVCAMLPGTRVVQAASQGGISVQSSASVDGDEIHMGEVAQVNVQGFARQMLEQISLGRSPRPGKVKTISKRQFLSSLRPHQDLMEGMVLDIPDRVYVKRSSQKIADADIRFYLEGYLGQHFKGKEVSLERLEIRDSGPYPLGEVTMAVAGRPRISQDGRFSMGVEIYINSQKEDRIRVSGQLAVYETLVVASRQLSRGECLSEGDGSLVRKNIFSQRGEGAVSLDALPGKTLTADVEKGNTILVEWLKPTPLIHKGDVVTLVARKDTIQIQTFGISREDGFKDSLVEVENIRSGKVVRGLVRKPSTVEVIY